MKKKIKIIVFLLFLILSNCESFFDVKQSIYIDVPYRDSVQADACGAACVQMWTEFSGNSVPQQLIIDTIGAPTSLEAIAYAVNQFSNDYAEYSSFSNTETNQILAIGTISSSLDEKHPAVVPIWGAHAIIATGERWTRNTINNKISAREFRFHVPDYRDDQWYSLAFFKSIFEPYENPHEIGLRYRTAWYMCDSNLSSIESWYDEFLKNNGTYYGGPENYIPEGSVFLRVGFPIGGEILPLGKDEDIKWEYNGVTGNIKLELYKDNNFVGEIAENIPIENGIYSWTVGQNNNGISTAGDTYKIKISLQDNSYEDFSNKDFSISDINITQPNGNESWVQGTQKSITWDSSYLPGEVTLLLVKTTTGTEYLIEEFVENTGQYDWTVGLSSHVESEFDSEPYGLALPDNNYKIKVVSIENPKLWDESDNKFAIVSPEPTISVINPQENQSFYIGRQMLVQWDTNNITGDVRITLRRQDGSDGYVITESTPYNNSPFSYTISEDVTPTDYFVRVKQNDSVEGISGTFSILQPKIIINSPISGEIFNKNDTLNITWSCEGVQDNIRITLRRTDGSDGYVITESIPFNENTFQYIIPPDIALGNYFVRIKQGALVLGESGSFSIIQ